MKTSYTVVGKRVPRIDARAKVRGEAIYTLDMTLPGMLCGKILTSPHPHARILGIDTSRAERLPGVKGVITWKDNSSDMKAAYCYGAFIADEYPLAVDRVRFIGDEVAAVAAVDEDVAQEALGLIDVEYEPLPAVFDAFEAMEEGAPQLHTHAKNNISWRLYQDLGDVEEGFSKAYHIQEDRFVTQAAAHAPLEPHVAIARPEPDGSLTIWSSAQKPFFVSLDVAQALGVPASRVRVIKPHMGGGFGGKEETSAVDFCVAFLARKTGRPVKIALSREEEFMVQRRRHPFTFDLKTAVRRDGTILARECRSVMNGGAYNSIGVVACYLSAIFLALPYRNPAIRYEALRVYTNNAPSGAMRGFGAPQTHFATEVQMDMIAETLDMDPAELRIKNSLRDGERTPSGVQLGSCALPECIRSAVRGTGWRQKRAEGGNGTGIGMGCNGFISGPRLRRLVQFGMDHAFSGTILRAHSDGRVTLISGSADIGQGSDSVMAQIAAEELGIRYEDLDVEAGDTQIAPLDYGTYGSRVTMMAGNATRLAAADMKKKILVAMAEHFGCRPDDLDICEGRVFRTATPERSLSFAEAVRVAQKALNGGVLVAEGVFSPDEGGVLSGDDLCRKGMGNYSPAYSFGTHVAEVRVDIATGEVRVVRVSVAHDIGQAINPMAVEGQLEGSVAMGAGYALTEKMESDNGLTLNPSFLDYKVPLSLDAPEIEVTLVSSDDPSGPFGAKEAGEGPVSPTAPSIANAIHNAVGIWIRELPITPEAVLRALDEKRLEKERPQQGLQQERKDVDGTASLADVAGGEER